MKILYGRRAYGRWCFRTWVGGMFSVPIWPELHHAYWFVPGTVTPEDFD